MKRNLIFLLSFIVVFNFIGASFVQADANERQNFLQRFKAALKEKMSEIDEIQNNEKALNADDIQNLINKDLFPEIVVHDDLSNIERGRRKKKKEEQKVYPYTNLFKPKPRKKKRRERPVVEPAIEHGDEDDVKPEPMEIPEPPTQKDRLKEQGKEVIREILSEMLVSLGSKGALDYPHLEDKFDARERLNNAFTQQSGNDVILPVGQSHLGVGLNLIQDPTITIPSSQMFMPSDVLQGQDNIINQSQNQEQQKNERAITSESSGQTGDDGDDDPVGISEFTIQKAAFAAENKFYIAPKTGTDVSLSKAQINSARTGVDLVTIVPDVFSRNGQPQDDADQHILKNKLLENLALAGNEKLPVVTTQGTDDLNVHYLIKDDGSQVHNLKDGVTIKDANGVTINQEVVDLAASHDAMNPFIFAAVADGSTLVHKIKKALDQDKVTMFGRDAADLLVNGTPALDGTNNATVILNINKFFGTVTTEQTNYYESLRNILSRVINIQTTADKVTKILELVKGDSDLILTHVVALVGTATLKDVKDAFNNDNRVITQAIDSASHSQIITNVGTNDDEKTAAVAGLQATIGITINKILAETFDDTANDLADAGAAKTWVSLQSDTSDDVGANVAVVDGSNRGIAILQDDGTSLVVRNPDNVTNIGTKARKVNLDARRDSFVFFDTADAAQRGISFFHPGTQNPITRATIGDDVVMHYDQPLERLYLGFSDITRGADTGSVSDYSGGVCSVLMGRKNATSNSFEFFPVISNVSAKLFTDDSKNHAIGFHQVKKSDPDDDIELHARVHNLKTMHTSTGKSYLIVNGGVEEVNNITTVNTPVYAFPLISDDAFLEAVGFVAAADDHEALLDGDIISNVFADVKRAVAHLTDDMQANKLGSNAILGAQKILDNNNAAKIVEALVVEIIKASGSGDTSLALNTVAQAVDTVAQTKDSAIDVQSLVALGITTGAKDDIRKLMDTAKMRVSGVADLAKDVLKPIKDVLKKIIDDHKPTDTEAAGAAAAIEAALGYALGRNFDRLKGLLSDIIRGYVLEAIRHVKDNILGEDARSAAEAILNDTENDKTIDLIARSIIENIGKTDTANIVKEVFTATGSGKVTFTSIVNAAKAASSATPTAPVQDQAADAAAEAEKVATNTINNIIINSFQIVVADTLKGRATKSVLDVNVDGKAETGAKAALEAGIGFAVGRIFADLKLDEFSKAPRIDNLTTKITGTASTAVTDITMHDFAVVGRDPQLLSFDKRLPIRDLQVHGDTVYASVAAKRLETHTQEAGIFASTALFDEKGKIRSWTPWQRVMGSLDGVKDFDFDVNASNFWYISTETGAIGDDADAANFKRVNSNALGTW